MIGNPGDQHNPSERPLGDPVPMEYHNNDDAQQDARDEALEERIKENAAPMYVQLKKIYDLADGINPQFRIGAIASVCEDILADIEDR